MKPTEFIKSLGDTSAAVADSLRKLGVRGFRGSGNFCPIANAINFHSDGWGNIRVSSGGRLTYNDAQLVNPKTTQAVKDFVMDFDNGMYPYLDVTAESKP